MYALRRLLDLFMKMNEEGEFDDLTSSDLNAISQIIHKPKSMGREAAASYLGVSLTEFHHLKNLGVIKAPKKRRGFKEKEYFVCDLDAAAEYIKAKNRT